MRELEETNCEIRNIINLDIPQWDQLDNLANQVESTSIDGSKDLNLPQTCGGFLNSECKYAWLSHEKRLLVIDVRYGKCISTWSFPNKITSVCSFPMEPGQVPLLLVGTDNNAIRIKDSIGYLYVYDCNTSVVLTTIQVPAGIEKACVIHGGAKWEEYNEKRPDTVLPGNSGLIFAALRNLQHIVIDVNRLLWQNALQSERTFIAKVEFVNASSSTSVSSSNRKELAYLAYDLMDKEIEQNMGFDREDFESTPLYDENLCSVLLTSTKTGCLISGCLGRIIIWQSDGSVVWISPPFDENAYVTHVALLEPSDDPRPFYYLWIACQNDSVDSSAVLRMYAMLFNKKHSDKSGESSLYFNLESEPSLKFELELERGERVHSLISVERENPRDPADCGSRRGEDSLLLIGSDERVLLFDLNRWYKEQMPRTMAECLNPNSVMASYRTRQEDTAPKRAVISCCYLPRSLRELPIKGPSSPEELFYPNSLSLEWLELGLDTLIQWLARGVQAELLREITIAGPIVLVKPTEIYRRCLASGLVPFDSVPQDFGLDASESDQRQMLLSICLEQRWASYLLRCALDWSDGSAAYLYPEFLRWGVQRASELKLMTDQLCVPLFDHSGLNIGESEVKTLRFCGQQLECLANVVSRLPNLEADLERQRRALKRIATYLQVLLWFYDVGLLPENHEVDEQAENNVAQMSLSSKIPYPKDKLIELYQNKRESCKTKQEESLFIDQLMSHGCVQLKTQWQREAGNHFPNFAGYYPPPSLQTLLRSFLTDCYQDNLDTVTDEEDIGDLVETRVKHSITIYLLMDLAMLLQNSHPSVDRLIKYPSAFKLSPSIIKLTQAFWLLDHEDYEGFFNIITGELISMTDIKDWHHRLAIGTLLQNNQHKLALMYLRTLKPPLCSLQEQGVLISLSVEQGLVESAFHARPSSHYNQLLTKFFQACKANDKLKEILLLSLDSEEEDAFVKFLKETECEDIKLLYYLQRCRHAEAKDIFGIDTNRNPRRSVAPNKINPITLKMLGAFNNTLPTITKRFANALSVNTNSFPSPSSNKVASYQLPQTQSFMDHPSSITSIAQGYPKPMSQCRIPSKEIYKVAVQKTRETCLKAGRINTSVNYVPFLGAPSSTIVFCTRATGNVPEQTDANCVLFPERKVTCGKRTLDMKNDGNMDVVDGNSERKRPRLGSISETNLLNEEKNAQLSRRLSMSQVCDTPLIQRKDKDPNSLAIETPHSILKIRQLLKRNSNSPGYSFNLSSDQKDGFSKPTTIGDVRPARQIRFSVERFSGNEDSLYSMNDTNQEQDEHENNASDCSKNTDGEAGIDEAYYSPNASIKSSRNSSILTDGSITRYFRGPRPRPSLRRSSLLSHASSDYLSQKTGSSNNSTLSASALDVSDEKSKRISTSPISPRKSLLSHTVYDASILSPNTSVESSLFKRPFTLDSKHDFKEETDDSEELSEDEEEIVAQNPDDTKNLSIKPVSIGNIQRIEPREETEDKSENEEMETQSELAEYQRPVSINYSLSQNIEISNDDKIEETKESEQSKNSELEKGECDSFQSFSNSMDNLPDCIDPQMEYFNDNANDILKDGYETRLNPIYPPGQDYSLTDNINLNKVEMSYKDQSNDSMTQNIDLNKDDESSNEHYNYNFMKPIFIDSHGMAKFENPTPDITDDESMDDEPVEKLELESVAQSQNKVEDEENDDDNDLKLNLSSSDDNAPNNEQFISNTSTKANEFSCQEEEADLSDLSPVLKSSKRKLITPVSSKDSSLEPLLSVPLTLKDDIEKESTPLRRSSRKQSLVPKPSPRRPIKSLSPNPVAKARDSAELTSPSQMSEREKRNTSTSKEVGKILPTALEGSRERKKDNESTRSCSNSISQSLEIKLSQTLSKDSSRESSQDKDESEEMSIKSKQFVGAIKKESNVQTIATRTRARAGSSSKEVDKILKKARATSVVKDDATVLESSADSENLVDETTEKKTRSRIRKTVSTAKDIVVADKIDESEHQEVEKSSKTRGARAFSQTKDASLKPVRKTRTGSVAQEEKTPEKPGNARKTRAGSVAQEDDVFTKKASVIAKNTRAGSVAHEDMFVEKASIVTRKTRAGSVTQELVTLDDKVSTTIKKTRAGSVAQEQDTLEEKTSIIARKTRAGSIALEDATEEKAVVIRKTKTDSVIKGEDASLGGRKTRAASIIKDTNTSETIDTATKRSTRATSVTKDTSTTEHEDISSKRPIRKRGGSVPKDAPTESNKLYPRNRRSTSLLQEVILEENFSQLDSPASKRSRLPRSVEESAVSSPAANTRSRRSSIQSVPEELEEILSVPAPVRVSTKKSSNAEGKDNSRSRRATSVDSTVVVPVSKRVTRSVMAKTAIIEQVIPEEAAAAKSPVMKKQPMRRKRATSVPVDAVEETEKAKPLSRQKRGRKASESKVFEFSVPEEAGILPEDAQAECRTPTYEFSKPAGFQKFISPIPDDEDTSDVTTNVIKRINAESERATSVRMRRPRTCFVLPKKTKNKAN